MVTVDVIVCCIIYILYSALNFCMHTSNCRKQTASVTGIGGEYFIIRGKKKEKEKRRR